MKNLSPDIPVTEFAALIGLDWGHSSHAIAIQISGEQTQTLTLDHCAENLHQWLDQLEKRLSGKSVAVAIAPLARKLATQMNS